MFGGAGGVERSENWIGGSSGAGIFHLGVDHGNPNIYGGGDVWPYVGARVSKS